MEPDSVPLALAFVAGTASFLSPCHLAVVPGFLGYLGGSAAMTSASDRWRVVRRTVLFTLGFSLAMVGLGMSVGLVGFVVWDRVPLLRKIGGVLLLVFGLHTLGLLRLSLLARDARLDLVGKLPRTDWAGFVLGLVFGLGWTPCVGPVLAGILLLATDTGTVWQGGALLATYAAGLSLPFLALSVAVGQTRGVVRALRRVSRPVELATGTLLLGMGVLLYTNQLQRVSALFGVWSPL
jgi:cytochrome c-type biogenesis protein